MSAIKKAVRKVVTKSSSLTSSSRTSSRDAKQPRSSLSNGRHSLSNQSPSSSSSAELPPQPSDHISHSNGTHYRSRNLSFTELKVERREERQTRDEAEANARRLKHIRLHEQVGTRRNRDLLFFASHFIRTPSGIIMVTFRSTCRLTTEVCPALLFLFSFSYYHFQI